MNQLEYDILTVQPMYLYEDDIEFLREYHPHVLKNPEAPYMYTEEYSSPVLNMICNNGWLLVKDECRYPEVDKLISDYRKEKYLPYLNEKATDES